MKKRLFILNTIYVAVTMSSCIATMAPATDVAVYQQIPLAPNVVLTVETPVIAAPSPNYIWIDGYWTWDYGYREYVWVPGRWEVSPYAGAVWIPGYWEYTQRGYRWINAMWLPRNYQMRYGYASGRYDYYGRPVYYQQPVSLASSGYAYAYDHRPEYRSKSYSSSPVFNETPKTERTRVTQEYRRTAGTTETPARKASTNRNTQSAIRVRTDDSQPESRETTTTRTTTSGQTRTGASTTTTTRSSSSSSTTTTTTTRSTNTSTTTQPAETNTSTRSNTSGSSSTTNSRSSNSGRRQ